MANVAHEVQTNDAAREARVDMKFEIVVIPVWWRSSLANSCPNRRKRLAITH